MIKKYLALGIIFLFLLSGITALTTTGKNILFSDTDTIISENSTTSINTVKPSDFDARLESFQGKISDLKETDEIISFYAIDVKFSLIFYGIISIQIGKISIPIPFYHRMSSHKQNDYFEYEKDQYDKIKIFNFPSGYAIGIFSETRNYP